MEHRSAFFNPMDGVGGLAGINLSTVEDRTIAACLGRDVSAPSGECGPGPNGLIRPGAGNQYICKIGSRHHVGYFLRRRDGLFFTSPSLNGARESVPYSREWSVTEFFPSGVRR